MILFQFFSSWKNQHQKISNKTIFPAANSAAKY
jgi:hypothetical protein